MDNQIQFHGERQRPRELGIKLVVVQGPVQLDRLLQVNLAAIINFSFLSLKCSTLCFLPLPISPIYH
jgi:hypothetical protein